MEIPRCQVDGCNLDLSSAKDYHRKNRVCESHSKSPKVIVAGLERRFCQQCSRFHNLSEFDQKKRSCRKRLSDHNARRRKPKPDIMQFGSMMLSTSLYAEGRHQMSLAFNQVPLVQPRLDANPTAWDSTSSYKFGKANLGLLMPTGTGDMDELQSTTHNEVPDPGTKLCPDSMQLLPSKGRLTEVFHRGLEVHSPSSQVDGAQDLRALSLLSSNSWGSCGPEPVPLNPAVDSLPLFLPSAPSVYWEGGQPVTSELPAPYSHKNASSHFPQEFQLFKEPQEPGLYWF